MSAKNRDKYGRWRSVTIAFRVTPQENELLNRMVKLSGLTKQDYITSNMLKHDIVVIGNPKVFKALSDEMDLIHEELVHIQSAGEMTSELIDILKMTCDVYTGMKGE